jgi:hypothetical protein
VVKSVVVAYAESTAFAGGQSKLSSIKQDLA